jgi:hypothetical protein
MTVLGRWAELLTLPLPALAMPCNKSPFFALHHYCLYWCTGGGARPDMLEPLELGLWPSPLVSGGSNETGHAECLAQH